jgi:hypothetical protein
MSFEFHNLLFYLLSPQVLHGIPVEQKFGDNRYRITKNEYAGNDKQYGENLSCGIQRPDLSESDGSNRNYGHIKGLYPVQTRYEPIAEHTDQLNQQDQYNGNSYAGTKNLWHGLKIKDRTPFGVYQVFDSEPESHEQIEGKSKSQCYKGQVYKGYANNAGSYPPTFRNPTAYFEPPLLEEIQQIVKPLPVPIRE